MILLEHNQVVVGINKFDGCLTTLTCYWLEKKKPLSVVTSSLHYYGPTVGLYYNNVIRILYLCIQN